MLTFGGVIHRDVKSSNVLRPDVGVKVVDFGTAAPAEGEFVLVGGSGNIGHRLTALLCAAGAGVTVVDRVPPRMARLPRVSWLPCDLLEDQLTLPRGRVVVLLGGGHPPRWPWRAALDIAVPTARLLPALDGRDVVLPLCGRPTLGPRWLRRAAST